MLHVITWKDELDKYVYNFFVDYDTVDIKYITDIHKYLMKNHIIINDINLYP